MSAKTTPDDHQSVIPYLIVKGVSSLIEFLAEAFDAEEVLRTKDSDGITMHAQVRIRDSVVMMGEAGGAFEPKPASIYMYVEDVDAVYGRALDAGAVSVMEPADMFYGDRNGGVKDPAGNIWWIATRVEDVSAEELQRRAASRERAAK